MFFSFDFPIFYSFIKEEFTQFLKSTKGIFLKPQDSQHPYLLNSHLNLLIVVNKETPGHQFLHF